MTTPTQPHYLTYRDVCIRYKIGSSTLYRWIAEDRFPAGILMGKKSRRWPMSLLVEWENRQTG